VVWEQGDLAVVAARRTEPSNVRPEVTSMTDSVAMVVPE